QSNQKLSVFRKFPITERRELRFQAEALNLTNTPSLNQPNATASTPSNFMAITSTITTATSPQPTIRLGLRLSFYPSARLTGHRLWWPVNRTHCLLRAYPRALCVSALNP